VFDHIKHVEKAAVHRVCGFTFSHCHLARPLDGYSTVTANGPPRSHKGVVPEQHVHQSIKCPAVKIPPCSNWFKERSRRAAQKRLDRFAKGAHSVAGRPLHDAFCDQAAGADHLSSGDLSAVNPGRWITWNFAKMP
jgi:hypothetical protein